MNDSYTEFRFDGMSRGGISVDAIRRLRKLTFMQPDNVTLLACADAAMMEIEITPEKRSAALISFAEMISRGCAA